MLDNISIGNRLKEARQLKRLTLKNVADTVGIAASTVARYEAGHIEKIKLPVIEALSRCLDVNPLWILGKSNSEKANDNITLQLSSDEKEIIITYRNLNDNNKEKIRDYISLISTSNKRKIEKWID